jgi:hypothetical protein
MDLVPRGVRGGECEKVSCSGFNRRVLTRHSDVSESISRPSSGSKSKPSKNPGLVQ